MIRMPQPGTAPWRSPKSGSAFFILRNILARRVVLEVLHFMIHMTEFLKIALLWMLGPFKQFLDRIQR
jgi:hypothetical protein